MDTETVEARLRDAGLADTVSLDLAATIRPTGDPGQTLAADAPAVPRGLPHLSIDLAPPPALEARAVGSTATDIEIREVLGEGGMGRVLLARQHSLERDVAVKTAKAADDPHACAAILAEGAVTGRLEHPAIVPVHALGLDASRRPAMVMKRVEGVAWSALLKDPGHPGWDGWEGSPEDRLPGHLQILTAICNALHFAHSRGVVHRDVKPENVLIGRFGDVYLADWGVAGRVGEERGRLCGTPGYMAPEMVSGRAIGASTDVYLLGATLHEVLTGELRHPGETLLASVTSALLSEPYAYGPDTPRQLADLANAACHVDPAARPATAQAFRDAIGSYLRHRDSAALAQEATERLARIEALSARRELDEDARRELDRLVAEARFGLRQAVQRWPENDEALGALSRLDAVLEARRARIAALERDARERDPHVDARPRALGLGAVGLVSVAITVAALKATEAPGPMSLVAYPTIITVSILVGAVFLRKRVLRTRFNRQMFAGLMAMMLIVLAGRVLGLFTPITVAEHFARDSFLLASGSAVMGAGLLRWVGWLSPLFLAVGVACTVFPSHALPIFGVATAVAIVLSALLSWWFSGDPR